MDKKLAIHFVDSTLSTADVDMFSGCSSNDDCSSELYDHQQQNQYDAGRLNDGCQLKFADEDLKNCFHNNNDPAQQPDDLITTRVPRERCNILSHNNGTGKHNLYALFFDTELKRKMAHFSLPQIHLDNEKIWDFLASTIPKADP